MNRSPRKRFEGEVVSNKMQKTVVVSVTRKMRHPRYQKLVEKRKKVYAHNEIETLDIGDKVLLMETRPLSKLKRWRVIRLLTKKD